MIALEKKVKRFKRFRSELYSFLAINFIFFILNNYVYNLSWVFLVV